MIMQWKDYMNGIYFWKTHIDNMRNAYHAMNLDIAEAVVSFLKDPKDVATARCVCKQFREAVIQKCLGAEMLWSISPFSYCFKEQCNLLRGEHLFVECDIEINKGQFIIRSPPSKVLLKARKFRGKYVIYYPWMEKLGYINRDVCLFSFSEEEEKDDSVKVRYTSCNDDEPYVFSLDTGSSVFSTDIPIWNEYLKCYTMEFHPHIKKPSCKNCKLVDEEKNDILQFGKVKKGHYFLRFDSSKVTLTQSFFAILTLFDIPNTRCNLSCLQQQFD
jgi:Tub family